MENPMTTPATPEPGEVLLGLLKQAAAAHGIHERENLGGVYDEAWPEWYAAHMARALAEQGYRLVPATDTATDTAAGTPAADTAAETTEGARHEPL